MIEYRSTTKLVIIKVVCPVTFNDYIYQRATVEEICLGRKKSMRPGDTVLQGGVNFEDDPVSTAVRV